MHALPATLQERIAELVNEKKIEGIAEMRDESDRSGMRIVIELKREAMPDVKLPRYTGGYPEDAEVHVSGIGIMGGFDHKASGPGVPGAPRVIISGLAFWGGVGTSRRARKSDKRRLEGGQPTE